MSQETGKQSKIDNQPSKIDEPWTVQRLRQWTADFLKKKGVEKAERDASELLAHALGWKRIETYARTEVEPPEDVRQRFRDLVRQRAEGCPMEYLIGRGEFFKLELEISPAVLIPREDSTWIVTEYLRLAKGLAACTVLDLGTGSGCLAVAVARHHPAARVTAVDLSPEALAVATRNAGKHSLSDRITFLEGDLFAPLAADQRFDFILSNPPYIARAEFEHLDRSVRDFEPRLALDGGVDGFAILDRIFDQARTSLKSGGHLIVEIAFSQEEAARARLESLAGYEVDKTVHDSAGHPRVLCARWQPPAA